MSKRLAVAAGILVVVALGWWLRGDSKGDGNTYRFVSVERGDLEAVVSATGALEALSTVAVGTQVSGIISETRVDFNDRVRRGQILAVIDTTLLAGSVRDAEAGLERAQAELAQREEELRRAVSLHENDLASDADLDLARTNLDVARASLKSARVNLDRAKQNLDYAVIRSPIDGSVIERNVDPGQTVQASFSAPQLFLLAEDLSRMQIRAAVDESDIGRIEEGQRARFTVQAYPDERFEAQVRHVRMQSTTTENVVSYTVVVDVANPDGRLLPGMTATVDFITGAASNVLMVPNAALRFRPPPEVLAELREERQSGEGRGRRAVGAGARSDPGASAPSDTGGAARAQPRASDGRESGASGAPEAGRPSRTSPLLWTVENGKLRPIRVRTGITDGRNTEVEGPGLSEGMQVVSGMTAAPANGSNPFQGSTPQRRGPGGF